MNRLRAAATHLATGITCAILGAACSLPAHGTAKTIAWWAVSLGTAAAAGIIHAIRSDRRDRP